MTDSDAIVSPAIPTASSSGVVQGQGIVLLEEGGGDGGSMADEDLLSAAAEAGRRELFKCSCQPPEECDIGRDYCETHTKVK